MKKYEDLNEIHQNAEKKNTGLTEELKQLKKNQKKTSENLKTEEDKVFRWYLATVILNFFLNNF